MRGPTKIEVAALVGILAVLAALVIVLMPCGERPEEASTSPVAFEAAKKTCMNNVRNIVELLEFSPRYPERCGPNLILYFVKKGTIQGRHLPLLFCPGDVNESLAKAGGADAYKDLDLGKRGEYGHLTSYAGRDQLDKENAAHKGGSRACVLVCDDSEDHHDGRGFVVGITGGHAKWRDKIDDWKLPSDTHVNVGKDSVVEELRCLHSE